MLRGFGWDVGLPVLGYYALHLAGVNDFVALLVASLLAAARIGWVAVRERELNPFATVYARGVRDRPGPRVRQRRPAVPAAEELRRHRRARAGVPGDHAVRHPVDAGRVAELPARPQGGAPHEYDTDPHVRDGHRLSSIVWGVGLLAEALVRVPLVFLLPIDVMVALGEVMTIAVIAGCSWNIWYVKRATARGRRAIGSGMPR
jgi:hypothetical protein